MHHFLRAHNLTAKDGTNALLPEADAKYRHFASEVLDHRHGDTRLLGEHGPGEMQIPWAPALRYQPN